MPSSRSTSWPATATYAGGAPEKSSARSGETSGLGSPAAASEAGPDVSPLRAEDFSGAPPAYVAVAGHDVLRDDGIAYARALEAAGVAVTLREFDDMTHGFLRWGGVVDRTRELLDDLGAHARAALRDA